MIKPKPTSGMRHVAMFVTDLEACEHFYIDLLGMQVEWRPDADNVYLTSGNDNLALHRVPTGFDASGDQVLDHIGFIIDEMAQVDVWFDFLRGHDVPMKTEPRTHRDGARSFYCFDPAGTTVQIIHHPPIVKK
ncbi:glyoxalase [Candidatus Tenderia electrophaga]|jgi:catechol 2,3-dioxygenase-like lactoylglutathione lyase family enzyme|uniref:Glyoxalase n=1 Tax=Candidatus Tenderia electrophaga TaxID=1748243 RepID=A0A0S2THM2_9GAMM|nr:glyoxalase [Candidatus Tenderia electrophaga]